MKTNEFMRSIKKLNDRQAIQGKNGAHVVDGADLSNPNSAFSGDYFNIFDDESSYCLARVHKTVRNSFTIDGDPTISREGYDEEFVKGIATAVIQFSMTPPNERKSEDYYYYQLPILGPYGDLLFIKKFDRYRVRAVDFPIDFISEEKEFHFTDEEVAAYPTDVQKIFEMCKKTEVRK